MSDRNKRPGEVWMLLKDRKLLARLMAIQGWSARTLATESGFKSHTYVLRLINGSARSCTAERAVAMAANLQVPLDSLFVTNVSGTAGRSVRSGRTFQEGTTEGDGPATVSPPRRRSRVATSETAA